MPFIVDGASPALLPATSAHLRALGDAGALPAYPRVLMGTHGYSQIPSGTHGIHYLYIYVEIYIVGYAS